MESPSLETSDEQPIATALSLQNGEWDIERLKKLVVMLKRKHETAAASLEVHAEENRMLKGQQILLRQLLEEAQRESEKARAECEKVQTELSERDLLKVEELQGEISRLQATVRTHQRDREEIQELLSEEKQNGELARNRLEKLSQAIKERDKRIADLCHFEYSCRKAHEQKQHVEALLELESTSKQQLLDRQELLFQESAKREGHLKTLEEERNNWQTLALKTQASLKEFEGLKEELDESKRGQSALQQETLQAKKKQREAETEVKALQEQFKQLKVRTIAAQQELKQKESALLEAHQIIEQIKFDTQRMQREITEGVRRAAVLQSDLRTAQVTSERWQRAYEEKRALLESLEREFESEQSRLMLSELEVTKKDEELSKFSKEIAELIEWRQLAEEQLKARELTITSLEKNCNSFEERALEAESLASELPALKTRLEQLLHIEKAYDELRPFHEAVMEQLQTAIKTISSLESREQEYCSTITSTQEQSERLDRQLSELYHSQKLLESQIQERDAAIKVAQHHFAKKVKECTLLEEKQNELQNHFKKMESFIEELNKKLEDQRHANRQLDESLAESKRSSDLHIRDWERKYFDKDEAWQQSEKRCQQIQSRFSEVERQLEKCMQRLEKYMQLEMMLKSLGVGSQQVNLELSEPQVPSPAPFEAPIPPPLSTSEFFELPTATSLPSTKYKEHLFD